MWIINDGLATYKNKKNDLTVTAKIMIIDNGDGNISSSCEQTDATLIKNNSDFTIASDAMKKLCEYIPKGRNRPKGTIYRNCRWCGKLFLLESQKREFCCDTCRSNARHLRNKIKIELEKTLNINETMPENFKMEFNTGKLERKKSEISIRLDGDNTVKFLSKTDTDNKKIDKDESEEIYTLSKINKIKKIAIYSVKNEISIWRYYMIYKWLEKNYI